MNAFKAYDIRGVYGEDFNKDDAYKIGYFAPKVFKVNRVLVGYDIRTHSKEIFEALSRGIRDAGADVYLLGLSTTPMVYYATAKLGFDLSIQITASHNPKEHNGFKFSGPDAAPIGYHSGLQNLENSVLNETISVSETQGSEYKVHFKEEYLKFFRKYTPDISNLIVGMDCSNGMAGLLIRDILGDTVHYINEEPDGNFPNHDPNPLNPENIKDLSKLVKEKEADIGVIFDGDADRVMFTDEEGRFISPDLIIALLGLHFLNGQKENVLQDIRSSKAVGEYLEPRGAVMNTWRVGRAFAALKLKEIDGLYGGELAGHYYFRDFYYSDSGILACLLVLEICANLKKEGKKLSEWIKEMSPYYNSGEMNFTITQKQEAIEAVQAFFSKTEKVLKLMDFDGIRMEFEDAWINIRPSNTEPYLRFIAEAKSKDRLSDLIHKTQEIIRQYK